MHTNEMGVLIYLYPKHCVCVHADFHCRLSLVSSRDDQYVEFIIARASSAISQKHSAKWQRVFRARSETVGDCVLIPSQNSLFVVVFVF